MANCTVQTENGGGVNVRSAKALSSSNLLGVIDDGATVNVVRCDGTWATLMYQGSPAFVQHQFLVNPPSKNGDGLDTGSNNKAVCNASNVNIRNAANGSTTGNYLNKGASVTIYDKFLSGEYYWYRIGTDQWVRGDFLAPGGSGSTGGGSSGTFLGYGTVTGGALYCRKQPVSNAAYWGRFPDDAQIPIYSCSTSGWYETRWPTGNNVGYVMSQYISMGGNPGGGSQTAWEKRYGTINYEKDPTKGYEEFKNVQRDLNLFFETFVDWTDGNGVKHYLTNYEIYPLEIDGVYGNASEIAVHTFQARMQLDQDYIVGPMTKQKLYDWYDKHKSE